MNLGRRPEGITLEEWCCALRAHEGKEIGIIPVFERGLVEDLVRASGSQERAFEVLFFVGRWLRSPWMDLLHSSQSRDRLTASRVLAPSPGRCRSTPAPARVRWSGVVLSLAAAVVPGHVAWSVICRR